MDRYRVIFAWTCALSWGCSSLATPVVSEDGSAATDGPSAVDADGDEEGAPSNDAGDGRDGGGSDAGAVDAAGLSCPADMALLPHARLCMDRYEASRGPEGEAVSVAGALPWVSLTVHDAFLACQAADKRLCTEREWMECCSGPLGWAFPYGDAYDEARCNGAAPDGALRLTGASPGCEGPVPGVYDLSGNAWEWTATCFENACYCVGGGYESGERRLRCDAGNGVGDGHAAPDVGFRCCSDPLGS